jgi:hypothetical protein
MCGSPPGNREGFRNEKKNRLLATERKVPELKKNLPFRRDKSCTLDIESFSRPFPPWWWQKPHA